MRSPVLSVIAATALALAVAPAAGGAQSTSGQDLTPEGRGAYLAVAGAIELFSVRSAEMVLEKAPGPEVRSFAETMLAEHRTSMEQLGEAARSVGLGDLMPPGMLPMHWDSLRDLEDTSSSRIDQVYIDQQVEAHEIAVELHRNFIANGNDARVKAYAEATLPTATRHLERARQLDR